MKPNHPPTKHKCSYSPTILKPHDSCGDMANRDARKSYEEVSSPQVSDLVQENHRLKLQVLVLTQSLKDLKEQDQINLKELHKIRQVIEAMKKINQKKKSMSAVAVQTEQLDKYHNRLNNTMISSMPLQSSTLIPNSSTLIPNSSTLIPNTSTPIPNNSTPIAITPISSPTLIQTPPTKDRTPHLQSKLNSYINLHRMAQIQLNQVTRENQYLKKIMEEERVGRRGRGEIIEENNIIKENSKRQFKMCQYCQCQLGRNSMHHSQSETQTKTEQNEQFNSHRTNISNPKQYYISFQFSYSLLFQPQSSYNNTNYENNQTPQLFDISTNIPLIRNLSIAPQEIDYYVCPQTDHQGEEWSFAQQQVQLSIRPYIVVTSTNMEGKLGGMQNQQEQQQQQQQSIQNQQTIRNEQYSMRNEQQSLRNEQQLIRNDEEQQYEPSKQQQTKRQTQQPLEETQLHLKHTNCQSDEQLVLTDWTNNNQQRMFDTQSYSQHASYRCLEFVDLISYGVNNNQKGGHMKGIKLIVAQNIIDNKKNKRIDRETRKENDGAEESGCCLQPIYWCH